jgi:ATP-dependent Clp protease adaptor protein ClpS
MLGTQVAGKASNRRYHHDPRPPGRPATPTVAFIDQYCARYRVLLYNDDVNSCDHVIASLLRVVPALSASEAERITQEAHTMGCAAVIVCLKEQAEHYRAGLRRQSLVSTIEPE